MKHIIAIHTVQSVYETFPAALRKALPASTVIDNIVDEVLANDPARRGGEFTANSRMRLYSLMMNAQAASPDLIVVTCSTLSPYIDRIREFLEVPVLAIDDAMCRTAAEQGNRICVLATAASALSPAVDKTRSIAEQVGRTVEIEGFCDPDAIAALKKGDRQTHDRLLLELSEKGKGFDIILLAQASMAHMREEVERFTSVRTLSSPETCIEAVVTALEE